MRDALFKPHDSKCCATRLWLQVKVGLLVEGQSGPDLPRGTVSSPNSRDDNARMPWLRQLSKESRKTSVPTVNFHRIWNVK